MFLQKKKDYAENPDYAFEHLKSQFMNLQAAQRNINKKADVPAISNVQVRTSLNELKQGNCLSFLSFLEKKSITFNMFCRLQQS